MADYHYQPHRMPGDAGLHRPTGLFGLRPPHRAGPVGPGRPPRTRRVDLRSTRQVDPGPPPMATRPARPADLIRAPRPRDRAQPDRGAQTRVAPNRPPAVNRRTPVTVDPSSSTRRVTCLICTDSLRLDYAIHLPCKHFYCQSCLLAGFRSSLTTMPFRPMRCCDQSVPVLILRGSIIIPAEDTVAYRKKLSEFNSPRPTYCSDQKCSAFIPDVLGGKCRVCRKKTCTSCGKSHAGVCTNPIVPMSMARVAERKFKRLSDLMGWKTCPQCRRVVEKIDGCNHIQCNCGCHFCYRCGKTPYGNHGPCAM